MGSLILREFKKTIRRRYTYAYLWGILGLVIIANAAVVGFRMIYGTNEGTYAYNLMEYATWCFVIPYYSCIFIADMAFGKEYPNPHIKDSVTKNISRTGIYLSKLIVSIMLALVFVVIAFVALVAITTVFQFRDGTISAYSVKDFLSKMGIAMPLWIAGLSIANMFLFIFSNKKKAFIGYFIVTLAIPRLIMLMAQDKLQISFFKFLRTYIISQQFSLIPYPADPARNVPLTIALGIIYSIVATVIGIVFYNRKKDFD